MSPFNLASFVRESNRIEGIQREPLDKELEAHRDFLSQHPTVESLAKFVQQVQPAAILRDRQGLNVVVGRYMPPRGGAEIRATLIKLLSDLGDPYLVHQAYEALHPFTDGNGRSGRALWLLMMGGPSGAPLGFLHTWYYQSLSHRSGLRQDKIDETFWRR